MTGSVDIMPGGGISRRPPQLFIPTGGAGAMKAEGRAQAPRFATASVPPHLATRERIREQAQVLLRVIASAGRAEWHAIGPIPVAGARLTRLRHVEKRIAFMWAAFRLVTEALTPGQLKPRALRPAILLIIGGKRADPEKFDAGLPVLFGARAEQSAIRIAAAIGCGVNSKRLARLSQVCADREAVISRLAQPPAPALDAAYEDTIV